MTDQDTLILVYEEVIQGLAALRESLQEIRSLLEKRRSVTVASDQALPTSVQVRSFPLSLQAEQQIRITLTNRGAATIFLGMGADASTEFAHSLLVGESFTVDTKGRIYVFTAGTGPERLDILYETAAP